MKNGITAEVCCGSVDDAVRAFSAGADRIELNSELAGGGLTPSVGALIETKKRVDIPVICMVRPRSGGFCYTELEYETMLRDANILLANGADGLAFGFLNEDGSIDKKRAAEFASLCKGKDAVFHRAADVCAERTEELADVLVSCGVTRVLTSGRRPRAVDGADAIARIAARANGSLQVLAGGGVRPDSVYELLDRSGISQVHFSCHTSFLDPSASGNGELSFAGPGAASPDRVGVVDEAALGEFLKKISLYYNSK